MKTPNWLMAFMILAVAGAALTGCGEDGTTEPKVVAAEMYQVTVTLDEFYVVGDCDELLGGKGEFQYKSSVRASGSEWDELANKSLKGDKGKGYEIDEWKTMTLDAADPQSIEVYFWATETDEKLFGDDEPDARMNKRDKINVHTHKGNGDWDLGSHSITLGNDNGCKVRLDYTVRSVKIDS